MFPLGHLGIGSALVRRFTPPTHARWVLAGTLVPDLIDKPLYYGLSFATGRRGADLGLVSGSRTFGHTALLLLVVLAAGWLARHRGLRLLALGMATHLLLDLGGELFYPGPLTGTPEAPSTLCAILYPLLGWRFPVVPFHDVAEHAGSFRHPYVLGGEIVGALALWRRWRRTR